MEPSDSIIGSPLSKLIWGSATDEDGVTWPTQLMPEEERHTLPEDYLKDRLAMMLAGRTSEKVLLGTVSSGADDDIRQATVLARAMIARWGMSDEIGPIDQVGGPDRIGAETEV